MPGRVFFVSCRVVLYPVVFFRVLSCCVSSTVVLCRFLSFKCNQVHVLFFYGLPYCVLSVGSFVWCLVLPCLTYRLVLQCPVESCHVLSCLVISPSFRVLFIGVFCLTPPYLHIAVSSIGVCAQVTGCDVAPNERKIVTCSFDRTVKVWAHENEF